MVLHILVMQHQTQADRNKLALLERKNSIRPAKVAADSAADMAAAKTKQDLAADQKERAAAEWTMAHFKKEASEPILL